MLLGKIGTDRFAWHWVATNIQFVKKKEKKKKKQYQQCTMKQSVPVYWMYSYRERKRYKSHTVIKTNKKEASNVNNFCKFKAYGLK